MTRPAHDADRFSDWRPAEPAHLAAAPVAAAVAQLKVVGRLLDYPRGRSAMVWYGALDGDPEALARAVTAARAALPGDVLVWRVRAAPRPTVALARLRAAFVARFGAPPHLGAS